MAASLRTSATTVPRRYPPGVGTFGLVGCDVCPYPAGVAAATVETAAREGGGHETATLGPVRHRPGDPRRRAGRARPAGADAAVRGAGAGLPTDDDLHDVRHARRARRNRPEQRRPRPPPHRRAVVAP